MLQQAWAETSFKMQSLRDNPACAELEHATIADQTWKGLHANLGFDPSHSPIAALGRGVSMIKPRVAILREQGVNGHMEMAFAFTKAGFEAVDVHMDDICQGRVSLAGFSGMALCGGFSYGDVLGAGEGWAKSILYNEAVCGEFKQFFERTDAFTLGVCNGCQTLGNLRSIIPGGGHLPHNVRNESDQFEARVCMVEVGPSNNIFLRGMEGSLLPVACAHGEGRVEFDGSMTSDAVQSNNLAPIRFVGPDNAPTTAFPFNPNGSPSGITGVSSENGRLLAMMPHPERCSRAVCNSWRDAAWGEDGPWMRMFYNARVWVHEQGLNA